MLILDNLEERDFASFRHGPFNLCHMRKVVATVAKFHAVSLTYKQMLFSTFSAQKAQGHNSIGKLLHVFWLVSRSYTQFIP